MAARAGDTEKCQQLLAARAEVDVRSKKWTPLMGAAELGHAGVVSLLLENKANVNAANKKGRSALSFAASPSDDGATRRESQILVMDLTTNKSASCSSLLIVLTAILLISYAIIQLLLCLLTMLPEISSVLERANQVSTCVEVQDAGTEIVCIALCKPVAIWI